MGWGGPRPNSGRKPKGSNRTGTKRLAKIDAGIMPADVMLKVMRFHYGRFEREAAKPSKTRDEAQLALYADKARQAASDVAPYYHPKLATLQSNVNLTGRLTLEALVMQSITSPANANEAAKLIEGEAEDISFTGSLSSVHDP